MTIPSFAQRALAVSMLGGALLFGGSYAALASSHSATAHGETRSDALGNAYDSAEYVCRVTNSSPSYDDKDCSRAKYDWVCVVRYSCR